MNKIFENHLDCKQQLERDFSKFVKDKYSKGPSQTVVHLYDECIVFHFMGFLNKAEQLLVQTGFETNVLINRNHFIKHCREELEEICFRILNRKINQFFPSYDLQKNEACMVIFLDKDLSLVHPV